MNPASALLVISFSCLLASCTPQEPVDSVRFDVLILNGTVYDGSVEPARSTNIGIVGDRIVSMNAAGNSEAGRVIDVRGLVVVPGFIDPHTHAREDLLDVERNANINYLTQAVTTVFIGNDGGGLPQRAANVETMQAQGIGTNVGFFAGHNHIREAVMGLENRAPSDQEMQQMQVLLEDEMRTGALGLSTGLFYKPGSYAATDEVVGLARIAAGFGGVYDSHMRDESSYNIGLLGAVKEVIQIGEEAGIPVHIAHLKALGRDVWGQSGDVIALIEAARNRGVSVTADQYPWRASGTRFGNALIPRWVMADSEEAMLGRLANPDLEDRIHGEIKANIWRRGGEDAMLVTGESEWRGKTLGEIAERMAVSPVQATIEVVRTGDPSIASFNMTTDDIDAIAVQPWVMTGSDGSPGHPRKYASYPKAYREFVLDKNILSLEQFVHRSSGLVADTFSLCDRGYLQEGRKADIAILQLEAYMPIADFNDPTALSTGVLYLLVNGALAIDGEKLTGKRSGRLIDRQNLDCST